MCSTVYSGRHGNVSVNTVLGYGLIVQLSLGTRNICSSRCPVDHGTHSASSLKGGDSFVSEGQMANGVKVNTHLWPLPRLGMNGAIPLLDPHTMEGTEVTSTVSGKQLNMQRNSSSSSSSCSWRIGRVSRSLILRTKLVPPSLPRSSYVPSSFWFIL